MALITLGALASDIKGKVGGTVFQRSASGLVMRNERGHINKRTSTQITQRNSLSVIQAAWINLSNADRTAWDSYAIFRLLSQRKNPNAKLTGHQIFVKENLIRYTISTLVTGITTRIIETPYFNSPPEAPTITEIENDAGALNVSTSASYIIPTSYYILKITAPLSASQLSRNNKYQLMLWAQATGNPFDITTAYLSKFGLLPETGQYVNVLLSIGKNAYNTLSNETAYRLQIQ